jgi:hypothetical protein
VGQSTESFETTNDDFFQDVGMGVPFVQEDLVFSSMEPESQFTQTTTHVGRFPPSNEDVQTNAFLTEEFSWAMIELGVQEPLPPQETIDELYVPCLNYSCVADKNLEHRSTSQKFISQCR